MQDCESTECAHDRQCQGREAFWRFVIHGDVEGLGPAGSLDVNPFVLVWRAELAILRGERLNQTWGWVICGCGAIWRKYTEND